MYECVEKNKASIELEMAKTFGQVSIGKAALVKSHEWVKVSLADDNIKASMKSSLDRLKSGLADIYDVGHSKFMKEGLFPACPELDVSPVAPIPRSLVFTLRGPSRMQFSMLWWWCQGECRWEVLGVY